MEIFTYGYKLYYFNNWCFGPNTFLRIIGVLFTPYIKWLLYALTNPLHKICVACTDRVNIYSQINSLWKEKKRLLLSQASFL